MPVKLFQLISPTFPVGAFSYSQGLEWACEEGVIHDAASAENWIRDVLQLSIAQLEVPLCARMLCAARDGHVLQLTLLNDEFLSLRETQELRAETLQMGYSFKRIARDLGAWAANEALPNEEQELTYPCAFAWACAQWQIAPQVALEGYVFAWCENQVMAAIKAVPLGQTAGQQMLARLAEEAAVIALQAMDRVNNAEPVRNFTPGLAMASSLHETQYSRLFRS